MSSSRKASVKCIYWISGACTANQYFPESTISCYNSGVCNSYGTCHDCSRYDVAGLKFATKSKGLIESTSTDRQQPMNAAVYSLRAKFNTCCNWNGAPDELTIDSSDKAVPYYRSLSGVGQSGPLTTPTKCTEILASDWQVPWYDGSKNSSRLPCNGAKSSCPYYTGPSFRYITDEKLEEGEKISAAQVMELRYYSKSWGNSSSARAEYVRTFKDPDIWAWSGDFDDETPTEASIPGVKLVTLFRAGYSNDFDSALSISPTRYGVPGTAVLGVAPAYPTAVEELQGTVSSLSIKWPVGPKNDPYKFRTFRIGQNKIYIIVVSSSPYTLYAVNKTKYTQGTKTDTEFVQYMLDNYPDDIKVSTKSSVSIVGTVFTLDLEYKPAVNEIEVFTANPTSTDGSMYTDTVYVHHKFFHAHLAQTSFHDKYGQSAVEPWVDRFSDFSADVEVKELSLEKPTMDAEVLWDSVAYTRPTIYPIQKVAFETVKDWNYIKCGVVALEIENEYANVVAPWTVTSGTQTAYNIITENLGIWCNRVNNPNIGTGPTRIEMEVVSKSSTGAYHPANVLFVHPKNGAYIFDPLYDKFEVRFAYTEYKQAPVLSSEYASLKYPAMRDKYMTVMPYDISVDTKAEKFSVEGMRFPYYAPGDLSTAVGYIAMSDFENLLLDMQASILDNERLALDSFAQGGAKENEIKGISYFFGEYKDKFNAKYAGKIFASGDTVTLQNLCGLVSLAGYYEGTQEYRVVFKDDTGRPIGVKRVALLMQSAMAACRDVEIFYKWRTQRAFVDARDHWYLLAMDYKPMLRSNELRESMYTPYCGDHSLQTAGQTFYKKITDSSGEVSWTSSNKSEIQGMTHLSTNEAGPLWYPYKACNAPIYHQSNPLSTSVLCGAPVEGFKKDLRRYYWERMRGDDIYWTVKIAPIFYVGCVWSFVEGNYQSIKDPIFAGFTRIRSNHLMGSFQSDREAIRISRHHVKRNMTVRTEWVRTEGYNGSQTLSSEGTARLFDSNGDTLPDEKPLWVHIFDDLSIVNRTTSLAKHPFSNLLLKTSAGTTVDEVFNASRVSLGSIFEERHLVSGAERDENGNLVYAPSEPLVSATGDDEDSKVSKGSDVFWVYSKKSPLTAWAWLERQKSPVRGTPRINGVFVYNPSINAFKKNMESATFMDDGVYMLMYMPPMFGPDGEVVSNPTLTFNGGPSREIDWITGVLKGAPSSYGKDPYDISNHTPASGAQFQIYGRVTSDGNGFLADASGKHTFEKEENVFQTFRGIAVRPKVVLELLPHTSLDAISSSSAHTSLMAIRKVPSSKVVEVPLNGLKFVENFSLTYGLGPSSYGVAALPAVSLDGCLSTGVWVKNIGRLYAKQPTATRKTGTQTIPLSGRYTKVRIIFGTLSYKLIVSVSEASLYVKDPIMSIEPLTLYNQLVNVSTGSLGNRYASDLLYYYGRTFTDFGLQDVNYLEVDSSGPLQQDLKWQNRSAKDILISFNFMDPTGTLYDFPKEPVSELSDIKAAAGGSFYIDKALDIHTKGQTVITREHVDDPIDAQASGFTWSNTVAPKEVSNCPSARFEGILDEDLQECLYKEASSLADSLSAEFVSFWHPDEEAFFKDTVGIHEMPSWKLELSSTLAPLQRVMRHPSFGCNPRYTNEYHDGVVHKIPPWRALGHLLYLGKPVWNWACTKVIMNKLGTHLGESLFEVSPAEYVSSRAWPSDSITNVKIEKPDFYANNKEYWDPPSGYVGGTMCPTVPTNISQALVYAPGGTPRGWNEEMSLYPQTKSWPLAGGDFGHK